MKTGTAPKSQAGKPSAARRGVEAFRAKLARSAKAVAQSKKQETQLPDSTSMRFTGEASSASIQEREKAMPDTIMTGQLSETDKVWREASAKAYTRKGR